jgi:hypothetical protein
LLLLNYSALKNKLLLMSMGAMKTD